jgi:hypothetical protein
MYSLAIAVVATLLLAPAFPRLRDTTLSLPWAWTLAAFWLLAVADLVPANPATRFLFAASALCPGIALMGARRPHHLAWQLIVGSLWLVIVLPALNSLAVPSEMEFDIVRQVFLLILVAIIVASLLPTRFGFSGTLLLAGFVILFGPQLPWSGIPSMEFTIPLASGLFLAGLVVAWLRPAPDRSTCWPADRLWLDFRDTFGTFWALRLADRVNRAAQQEGWKCHLGWRGFSTDDDEPLESLATEELHQYLRNIVRRFAGQAWIDRRLEKGNKAE